MGLLIDAGHPALQEFPTDTHSDWQWWAMCRGRSMLLPSSIDPIITGISCCLRMQKMGLLVEACVENGKLMLSSMGLLENLQYPEVTALLNSILRYMDSDAFQPAQTLQNLDELV